MFSDLPGRLTAFTFSWRAITFPQLIEALEERVVIDRNRITGGGITAGIDFGLILTSIVGGESMAKQIQLLSVLNKDLHLPNHYSK